MRPITRFFLYFVLIFCVLLPVALRPYNWFCQSSGKCQKIYLSDFLPSFEGSTKIKINLEAISYRKDLTFMVYGYDTITTVSGRKNVVNYKVKNLSNRDMSFRPKFTVTPQDVEGLVKRRDCLCFEEHIIKKGEELNLQSSFELESEADDYFLQEKGDVLTISYTIN